MKKIISLFLSMIMLFSLCLSVTSCGKEEEYPVTAQGIEVSEEPLNVVVLSKNIADILTCIGYDVKLAGRSDEVNQQGIEVVPSVGSAATPDVSLIEKAEADVVLADSALSADSKKQIQDLGILVFTYDFADTEETLSKIYLEMGTILGGKITGKAQAQEGFDELLSTLERIKETSTIGVEVKKTFAYVYLEEGVLKTVTSGNWVANVLEYSGGVNLMAKAETDVVDENSMLLANPDYLFCDSQEVIDYLTQNLILWELDALNGETEIIPLEQLKLQGYSSLEALETMVEYLYPPVEE